MNDNDEEITLKEAAAALYFGLAFAEYVKNVDLELWKRAREFAFDYCEKIDGVRLTREDNKNE